MARLCLSLLVTSLFAGCVNYEYGEEIYLETDGSGEIHINGSRELFAALRGVGGSPDPDFVTVNTLRRFYESPDLKVVSVKGSRREGRAYFHVRGRFQDINRLSHHPAFRGRQLRLEQQAETLRFRAEIVGGEMVPGVRGLRDDDLVAFRIHFPSPVHYHNSRSGVERGNIVVWQQTVAAHLKGEPLVLEARFDRLTVLAATLMLFGAAVGLVVLVLGAAIYAMLRLGRRQELALTSRPPLASAAVERSEDDTIGPLVTGGGVQ